MKFKNMPEAEPRDHDSVAMKDAISWLLQNGLDVRRPPKNNYQLKVSHDLSYYPDKGSIFRDGDPSALPERGLDALLAIDKADSGLITISRPKRRD